MEALRVDKLEVLGATAPWLDRDGDFSNLGVHSQANGSQVVQSAREFVTKVASLREAGLTSKAAFVLLRAYSQGHVTHLLRANYEHSGWAKQFDDTLVDGLEQLLGDVLDEGQREQCFLRLADGGLGFNSAQQAQEAAYLGSWALTLKDVASSLGVSSWQTFRARCAPLAASLDEAEAKMIEQSDGMLQPVDWVGLLSHPQGKLQSFWSAKLKETRKEKLMQELDQDNRVDLRSAGGPGAGGFLEVPTPFEDEVLKPMPEKHFSTMLQDRMRLQICPDNRTCQHRKQNGDLCGEPLDRRGKHALKCECGPSRTGRHDALRDCTANFHPKVCGYVACKEQRVTAWDRTNPRTGLLEEARLDVATRDAATGRKIFIDANVTCAHSGYEPRQRARAGKDGVAAADSVRGKRLRYPPQGGELGPLVFEAGGRPAEETVNFVRS